MLLFAKFSKEARKWEVYGVTLKKILSKALPYISVLALKVKSGRKFSRACFVNKVNETREYFWT